MVYILPFQNKTPKVTDIFNSGAKTFILRKGIREMLTSLSIRIFGCQSFQDAYDLKTIKL